ncbi:MAG: hypothetical protein FJZ09_00515 [Candidatus Omnitrophica bacterium]|nr:hypothetical protein [Candidatus Omnitrophota bacterium]
MSEHEFWVFLEGLWKKGRVQQVSCVINFDDPGFSAMAGYMQGHALLPQGHDLISEDDIVRMGSLLFRGEVSSKAKEAVLIILAHYPSETALTILTKYNLKPDKALEFFGRMALEECAIWNE